MNFSLFGLWFTVIRLLVVRRLRLVARWFLGGKFVGGEVVSWWGVPWWQDSLVARGPVIP